MNERELRLWSRFGDIWGERHDMVCVFRHHSSRLSSEHGLFLGPIGGGNETNALEVD